MDYIPVLLGDRSARTRGTADYRARCEAAEQRRRAHDEALNRQYNAEMLRRRAFLHGVANVLRDAGLTVTVEDHYAGATVFVVDYAGVVYKVLVKGNAMANLSETGASNLPDVA